MTARTCREVVEFLMDYLTHELDPGQRRALESHLAECDECVAYIRSYEQTVRLGKESFERIEEPADEQLPKRLMDAIVAARRRVT